MELAKIFVGGVTAKVVSRNQLPAGLIGGTVSVEYDDLWNGLNKTAVFEGVESKDVLNVGAVIAVPPEVIATPGRRLRVGFYGYDASETLAIPALYADLGMIQEATDPSQDISTDPSLPVWAQLADEIEDLKNSGGGGSPGSGGVDFKVDETLKLENGILSVNVTNDMEQDNTLPITSAGVYATVGNIEALLKTI